MAYFVYVDNTRLLSLSLLRLLCLSSHFKFVFIARILLIMHRLHRIILQLLVTCIHVV